MSEKLQILVSDTTFRIDLGRCGENLVREVVFDLSPFAVLGDGSYMLLHKRSADSTSYAVPLEVADGYGTWSVTSEDTAYPGIGKCELQFLKDETVAISRTMETYVEDTVTSTDTEGTSTTEENWLASMLEQLKVISGNRDTTDTDAPDSDDDTSSEDKSKTDTEYDDAVKEDDDSDNAAESDLTPDSGNNADADTDSSDEDDEDDEQSDDTDITDTDNTDSSSGCDNTATDEDVDAMLDDLFG